ncbi:MAG: hypothetical protein M1826_000998 [Phylliscum demangeonii]|nr:MAG: hypothetical protein M1826_000998 [Phylliscum demangeonii]
MLHIMSSQDELDDRNIEALLGGDPTDQGKLDFLNRDLVPGEKATDAVDFEDIDDDDLADEEDIQSDPVNGPTETWPPAGDQSLDPGVVPDDEADLDDLFADVPSSPAQHPQPDVTQQTPAKSAGSLLSSDDARYHDTTAAPAATGEPVFRDVQFGGKNDPNALMPPAPPENPEEALAAMWPKYRRDEIPMFMQLLPPKKARYAFKTPVRPPKPLFINKPTLDLAPDQEKAFRLPGPAKASRRELEIEAEESGLVRIFRPEDVEEDVDQEVEDGREGPDTESIGGISWGDIMMACADWDSAIDLLPSDSETDSHKRPASKDVDPFDAEWEKAFEDDGPPPKRQKINRAEFRLKPMPVWELPNMDNPEAVTAKQAKQVVLDLNDPELLIEVIRPGSAPRPLHGPGGPRQRGEGADVTNDLLKRYNIANDEAYDMLKANHQSKVRSTLGNLAVEHSVPALKLQYPYYKVKLARQEARSFHRPAMKFVPNAPVKFSKPRSVKRKHRKGLETQALFSSTRDLSLADNSHAMLLEYSEEYPTMLSNFGMGSRLINYYRRENLEDSSRPKLDVGETAVLMPQDRSPFSMFGRVDPGELVPTLHNTMFRAPVFKQNVPPTDFLVIRNTTGVDGSSWYMRNIDHLSVVGQQFPTVDVPGPHSRKVTNAVKHRLRMIAYRRLRKNVSHRLSVGEITRHFPDTTDLQNRQKLKEFMTFNKEHREWGMKAGETLPDEAAIRAMLKPEEVCLLEASQVGLQHLQDAGFGKDAEDSEDDDGKEGQSLEQQLAPWHTTRNFIHATQGKAMLQLHGDGEPTGRGEAFNFNRTSMKGGFKALGESVEDKLDAKRLKELGGHSYNVARQQHAYEESIRRIWEAQKSSLSTTTRRYETEMDEDPAETSDDVFDAGRTPRSEPVVPGGVGSRADDESTSQFSRLSALSQRGKVLRITREYERGTGRREHETEVIRDPRVIRQYLIRRHAIEAEKMTLSELNPTGDAEQDKRAQKRLEEELARLKRNKDRRLTRDKQKSVVFVATDVAAAAASPGSPGSPPTSTPKSAGTSRKCANCGQVGHIKTNKKLCPMLNGTMKPDEGLAPQTNAFGALPAPGPP